MFSGSIAMGVSLSCAVHGLLSDRGTGRLSSHLLKACLYVQ